MSDDLQAAWTRVIAAGHCVERGRGGSGARLLARAALASALGCCALASAQALRDPTRPPEASASPGAAESAPPARLQSVLISPGRRSAIIDGALVPLGGNVGGAKLVAVRETEVVLRKDGETEILKLYPAVEKKTTTTRKPRGQRPVEERK